MRTALGLALVAATVAVTALFLLPPVLGYQRYVIAGGSMEPHIPRGSVAYERVVPVGDLRRGDVITYVRPGATQPVTHRIIRLGRDGAATVVHTKGDANADPDFAPARLESSHQAVVAFHVAYAGWPLIWLADPHRRLALLGIPALMLVGWAFASLWREGERVAVEA